MNKSNIEQFWDPAQLAFTQAGARAMLRSLGRAELAARAASWGKADGLRFAYIDPKDISTEVQQLANESPYELEFEIVKVVSSVPLHTHEESGGTIIVLNTGSAMPARAHFYLRKKGEEQGTWTTIRGGEEINIPAGSAHGFILEGEGELTVLSVDTPKLKEDDRHFVTG